MLRRQKFPEVEKARTGISGVWSVVELIELLSEDPRDPTPVSPLFPCFHFLEPPSEKLPLYVHTNY